MSERRRGAASKSAGRIRRRDRKNIPRGKAFIRATFNNTIVTLTDPNGNVIAWSSAGANGFKGSLRGQRTRTTARTRRGPKRQVRRKKQQAGGRRVEMGCAPSMIFGGIRMNVTFSGLRGGNDPVCQNDAAVLLVRVQEESDDAIGRISLEGRRSFAQPSTTRL